MKSKRQWANFCLFIFIGMITSCGPRFSEKNFVAVERCAKIDPDYAGVVIPPNIAPLNFRILEDGRAFLVRAHSASGVPLKVTSRDGKIQFPLAGWKKLLGKNRGQELFFEIFVQTGAGQWQKYAVIKNTIAAEEIDSHLVYRLINPAFKYWNRMGIYQRDLETFKEKPIIINRMTDGNCMNCHNFCRNDPRDMVFHMRAGAASGTFIAVDGKWQKVNLKTAFNKGGAYPSWHPNGKLLAFSVNDLTMFYHALGEPRDVLDRESDLVVYHIDKNMISASPQIASEDRMETFPAWSADGRYLYFCSAGPFNSYLDAKTGDLHWDAIRYDLMRVAYDAERDEWGKLETVVPAEREGKSTIIPRPSPDGKYVLFCMSSYGSFSIYHRQGDLYLLDIQSGDYRRLGINSNETDSFHSWSSNSRWFVFTSKRYDTLLGRPFFAYIDEIGRVYKPFLLPQKDPDFYKAFIVNFNVPELTTGEVPNRLHQILEAAYDTKNVKQATLDPRVSPKKDKSKGDPDAMYDQAKPQN
jgi:hypothetical protein